MTTLGEAPPPSAVTARRIWPGPRGHWLLGCMRSIQTDPLTFYRETWRAHGDYVRIRAFAGYDVYLLADPAAVEHVLARNHKNYRKPDLLVRPLRLLAGNGVLTSEGESWLRQRRLMQPAFLRNHLATLSTHMVAAIDAINGYPVPARALVMPSQWVIHRHPTYWSEPDRFHPERFLPGNASNRPKFAYFPFGGGPRVCIGDRFAMVEGPLVLAALAQRFHLASASDRDVPLDTTFTLRPRGAVPVVVRKRA